MNRVKNARKSGKISLPGSISAKPENQRRIPEIGFFCPCAPPKKRLCTKTVEEAKIKGRVLEHRAKNLPMIARKCRGLQLNKRKIVVTY
jgi:hypothetical protein